MITLQDVVDVFTIISLVVAGSVALSGLNTWKEQTKRKFDWKLARRTLREIYKVRDAVKRFRDPLILVEEMAYAVAEVRKVQSDAKFNDFEVTRAVYGLRWNSIVSANLEFTADLLEVEAAWGKPYRKEIAAIQGVISRLFAAMSLFFSMKGVVMPKDGQIYYDIYNSGTDEKPDDFSQVLNDKIETAEGCLLVKLKL